ncbi:HAD family hydrolase [Fluviicola chungangensis]|uniref:HAD family hydrolase n=1 Tax=Fluviicola chungangensis TaxID=2597671 RepID=A0A556MQB6_9FLAO|nr:HAD family hydrolase [Fluviicola chungangensis]TSJ41998.1 HAD family hydrolase [Fluviicola chungangensis]
MIIVTDLDDTLYPEIEFVYSGFREVSAYLSKTFGIDAEESFQIMLRELKSNGRGKVFDSVLEKHHINTTSNRKKCLSVYRSHKPELTLYPEAERFLKRFSGHTKYLVTDGNVRVQRNKIEALGLRSHFIKTIPTYQYGIAYSKPSTFCFEKILSWEGQKSPDELVYIGDNPKKDFVSLNKMGAKTIRVLTGEFGSMKASPGFDAQYTVNNLDEITEEFITRIAL